jgi:hypothetical protein
MEPEMPLDLDNVPMGECIPVLLGAIAVAAALLQSAGPRICRARHDLRQSDLTGYEDSALKKLLTARSDSAYTNVLAFDVASFDALADSFRAELPKHRPPRDPKKRGRKPVIPPEGVLAAVLIRLTTGASNKLIVLLAGVVRQTLLPRMIECEKVLIELLRRDPNANVPWPSVEEMRALSDTASKWVPELHHTWGAVDGLNLPVEQPADSGIPNAYYNSWLSGTFVSGVFLFAFDGTIRWWRHNCPGSWHDAKIAAPLYPLLQDEAKMPTPFNIVADSAFPRTSDMAGKIISGLKTGDKIPAGLASMLQFARKHKAATSFRQTSEWGMGALQRTFRVLTTAPLCGDSAERKRLLELVVLLFNLRTRTVGFNQIRTVHDRVRDGEHMSCYDYEPQSGASVSNFWAFPVGCQPRRGC